jgi:hypothetical protein
MANTNAPFGLRPVRYRNGSPWNGKVTPYYVAAGYATALYIGDPVVVVGNSNAAEYFGMPAGSLNTIEIATGGDANAISGVIVGFLPVQATSPIYKPASTEALALVADDPNIVFEVQDDGGGELDGDTVGLNANLITGSGSTATGLSGWALDGGTSDGPDATATNQLLILGLSRRLANNELGSDYAIWDVLINKHTQVQPALGIA